MDKNYVKKLEQLVNQMLAPMRDLPFGVIIKSISNCAVLPFKKDNELLSLLEKSFNEVGSAINKKGIKSNRPNEVGNKIEPFVKKYLNNNGLKADTPEVKNGRKISAGYPDILFNYKNNNFYLECKSYNEDNVNTTQRSFYFSPSENFKVTKNASHLMVSFQIYKKNGKYFTNYWKLYSLENLKVDLKHEFNQNNREMYGNDSCIDVISEGSV